jgi:hypothetical protein
MKLPASILGLFVCMGAAFADDAAPTQKLAERKTCAEIKTEIERLLEIVEPDEATQATLKQLQAQQRANCLPKATGRRRVMRNALLSVVSGGTNSATETPSALSEYLENKKSNCEKLNSEIAKLAAANNDPDALAAMRGVYDMDCVDKAKTVATNTESAPATPEKTYEEWAAEYDANLAAGLCGDGTKPNKYGCCTDEVFKDLGNLKFACCPKTGGDCFPPIKK